MRIYELHLKIMTELNRNGRYLHEEINELRELLQDWDEEKPSRLEMGKLEKEIVGRKFSNRERAIEFTKLKSPLIMQSFFINAKWELLNEKNNK